MEIHYQLENDKQSIRWSGDCVTKVTSLFSGKQCVRLWVTLTAAGQGSVTFALCFSESQLLTTQRIYMGCMYSLYTNRSGAIVLQHMCTKLSMWWMCTHAVRSVHMWTGTYMWCLVLYCSGCIAVMRSHKGKVDEEAELLTQNVKVTMMKWENAAWVWGVKSGTLRVCWTPDVGHS